MMRKAPVASDNQRLPDGIGTDAFPVDQHLVDKNLYDICLQTGEEFSTEFLRDRMGLRRVNVMTLNADAQQPRSAGFTTAKKTNNPFYEDITGFLGHRRGYSDCIPDVSHYANAVAPDIPNFDPGERVHNLEEFSRYHGGGLEYLGQGHSVAYDNGNYRIAPENTSGSPQSYSAHGLGISEAKKMKFLCSYGGKILPRPNDGKLRYVGGETRIISIRANTTWDELVNKTLMVCHQPHTIKYQLPGEDLDALISVSSDEDLNHMIEEYHELERAGGSQKLRLFLVPTNDTDSPTLSSLESRTGEHSEADYQYVIAVNGIADWSPRKQTLPALHNQGGTFSGYIPGIAENSPSYRQVQPLEVKDYGNHSKLMERNIGPSAPLNSNNHPPFANNTINQSPRCNLGITRHFYDNQGCGSSIEGTISSLKNPPPPAKVAPLDVSQFVNHDVLKSFVVEPELANNKSAFRLQEITIPEDLSRGLQYAESSSGSGNICSHPEETRYQLSRSNELSENVQSDMHISEEKHTLAMEMESISSREWQMKSQDMSANSEARSQVSPKAASRSDDNTAKFRKNMVLNFQETCNAEPNMISAVLVEDVTNDVKSVDIPHRSRAIIPRIENEFSEDESVSRDWEGDGTTDHDIDSVDARTYGGDGDDPISDSAIAEMEAGFYGLQIIKNADLEELQELGSGTFGTVYHGKWRGTDVAIKRIKKSCFDGKSSEQERLTKDFWREAKILSNLHHPNVVAFYGIVPDGPGGTLSTVAEFMVNGSLRHNLLRNSRALDHRKKLIIAMDAAFGMEYLHLKSIVHFDLKCDNLLVNLKDPRRPICKVGDFGLSRIKQNTLVSGGVRGTLPWMAPELLTGNYSRVSQKVDVYSFGIAMWEMLTGEEPYVNMHCGTIIGGIVNNTLRPPIPERCDADWKKMMEECWAHEPSDRPSFTEIAERLRQMSNAITPKRNLIDPKIK